MLDARSMDIVKTAGLSALSASLSDSVFKWGAGKYNLTTTMTQAVEIGAGVVMIGLGASQRRRTSSAGIKRVGELLGTVGIGMVTAGVYNLTQEPISEILGTATSAIGASGNTSGLSGYISAPSNPGQMASLSGYTDQQPLYPNPAYKDTAEHVSLGDAGLGVQKSELNTYQIVN